MSETVGEQIARWHLDDGLAGFIASLPSSPDPECKPIGDLRPALAAAIDAAIADAVNQAERDLGIAEDSLRHVKRRLARLEEAAKEWTAIDHDEDCQWVTESGPSDDFSLCTCNNGRIAMKLRAALDAELEGETINGLGERAPITPREEPPGVCVERDDSAPASAPASEPARPEPTDDEARVREFVTDGFGWEYNANSLTERRLLAMLAAVRREERERCADHAENFLTLFDIDWLREATKSACIKETCLRLAAAIRAREGGRGDG